MGEKKQDSKKNFSEGFNLSNELSNLVNQKVIPKKIADKLEKKLIEKNVKLNKEQLHLLVNKIREVIQEYKSGKKPNMKFTGSETQSLINSIERLEQRIANIESGKPTKNRYVTTEDIYIPGRKTNLDSEWNMDPLTEIPNDPESIIILMKWLQYLVDRCGHTHLTDILDYYVDIGWITDDVKIYLLDYSQGLTEENEKNELKNKQFSNLPAKDHIQSLMYIQKLKGINFDRHFLDRIDGELTRISKKLDNYKFK